jgi:hypothetical protein
VRRFPKKLNIPISVIYGIWKKNQTGNAEISSFRLKIVVPFSIRRPSKKNLGTRPFINGKNAVDEKRSETVNITGSRFITNVVIIIPKKRGSVFFIESASAAHRIRWVIKFRRVGKGGLEAKLAESLAKTIFQLVFCLIWCKSSVSSPPTEFAKAENPPTSLNTFFRYARFCPVQA